MNETARISLLRRVIQWSVLIVFIAGALLYLRVALFSASMTGEASNPYSIGWMRLAAGQFCFALASVFFGLGLFKGIRLFPVATKRTAMLLVIGSLLVIVPYVGRYVLTNDCHARGQHWNPQMLQCSDE